MATLSITPLYQLQEVLQNKNPFAKPPYAGNHDVWQQGFPDLALLNAHVSDGIFQALEDIRTGLYPTTSIAITAQNGTGKTHLIGRIRQHLQKRDKAFFVYANRYGDANNIHLKFQEILADSLKQVGSRGVKQWQELATAMTQQVLQVTNPDKAVISADKLIQDVNKNTPNKVKRLVKQLTQKFINLVPVNDPDVVRAIFWTLSENEVLFASNWLGGRSLSEIKANELQLPCNRQSFDVVLQILDLISQYNELVICFDELDTPGHCNDVGLHISQVVASLVKDLLQNLRRGVILSVMMPPQWADKIKQLPGGVFVKMSAQTHGNPLNLNYLDENSMVELVTLWLQVFYESHHLLPPEPTYPFNQEELKIVGRDRPTVREALIWCRDNYPLVIQRILEGNELTQNENDPVEQAFINELNQDINLDDNGEIAQALLFSFNHLIGQTIENVTLESVTEKTKGNRKDRYMNFKILGRENNQAVAIGVSVLQDAGGNALGAGFSRLINYRDFQLTRGCLIRSKSDDKKISKYLYNKYIEQLISSELGGEWVDLKEEEVKPLIAIFAVYQKREVDYNLTEAEIYQFIAEKGKEKQLGASNPLIQEILSDPSYEISGSLIAPCPGNGQSNTTESESESQDDELLTLMD